MVHSMGRYVMKNFFIIVIISLFMILSGCVFYDGEIFIAYNCDAEIEKSKASHGEPDEIDKYDSGGYYTWTFWYWSEGFSMTFTWGTNIDGCKTSKNTFSPIGD